jgi:hypothetical protein
MTPMVRVSLYVLVLYLASMITLIGIKSYRVLSKSAQAIPAPAGAQTQPATQATTSDPASTD